MLILSGTKTIEEKEFYISLSASEKYSKREFERQINSAYYQSYMLSKQRIGLIETPDNVMTHFFDSYVLEFLNLPDKFTENDFKKAIAHNLKSFILEVGKDFSFVGEEYRVQVGNSDFYIGLL